MASRLRTARLGAVLLTATAISLTAALPAFAQTTARVDPTANENAIHIRLADGQSIPTLLIGLRMSDGTALKTYCVELTVGVRPDAKMIEAPWEKYPGADRKGHDNKSEFKSNPDKVNWILHHSYPSVNTEELSKVVGVGLDSKEAIAGTQAAIWHFSNKAALGNENLPDVKALYAYLTGDKNVGMKNQPAPSLELTPEQLSGAAGSKIGPFTVKSTASKIALKATAPSGVKVVGKDGKELTEATAGQEIWVDVPAEAAAGKASFKLEATAKIDKGRLFVANDGRPSQTLILAQATNAKLSAEAKVDWKAQPPTTKPTTTSPKPTTSSATPTTTSEVPATTTSPVPPVKNTGGLANTGASVIGLSLIGIVLVGGGVAAVVLQRRRKRA
ncbi:TQXA domain-containing protein/LPXTG-motif cell wall-anchored protein [Crossiella equi]|uniref:TQXA domain-containing protein/LPXTG-motif cell wall-anchored protein n=1 Tax=Crossiella equi TaxID=130796 RepID=A0ABS5AFI1_9PSEU|nr:thioester domain-containing protein [Crossiella equi]MBP2475346.1 TQXA domain-containing protein/LPXTG-motif cell wall-anchored protein [Crossiella equi]